MPRARPTPPPGGCPGQCLASPGSGRLLRTAHATYRERLRHGVVGPKGMIVLASHLADVLGALVAPTSGCVPAGRSLAAGSDARGQRPDRLGLGHDHLWLHIAAVSRDADAGREFLGERIENWGGGDAGHLLIQRLVSCRDDGNVRWLSKRP